MRNYLKYIYIFFSLTVMASFAIADTFNNSLLKTDISKSEIDGININLSTSKPYQDKVTVNKKNDNEKSQKKIKTSKIK